MKTVILKSLSLSAILSLGLPAVAETFYSATNYNNNAFTLGDGEELGNEIVFNQNNLSLTNFSFEYYTPNASFSGSVGVDVRFYLNDGTPFNSYPTPGTLFYDSGWFYGVSSVNGSTGIDINYSPADLYSGSGVNLASGSLLPTDFTFTVSFTNLVSGNEIDLPLANPPSGQIGGTYGDYWLNTPGGWTLLTNSVPASFIATFSGEAVPEPSVLALAGIGGAFLLLIAIKQRKQRKA